MNIPLGKKLILYGDERYIRDFMYIFDNLKPDYYIDDAANDFAELWNDIMKEDLTNLYIIICKYNIENAVRNMNSLGLKRGENYAFATEFFKNVDFPIDEISKKKRVYVWGTGDNSCEFFMNYVEDHPEIEIVGCVDSKKDKQGKMFFGRVIVSPEEVVNKEDVFFIIASKKYYQNIKDVLLEKNKKEGKDFIFYLNINNYASKMLRKTIFDMPRLDYVCPKMFRVAELKPEGKLLICGGQPSLMNWITPMYYGEFEEIWHSNIMKVLRLSAINGTYSFCNPKNCCYIETTENAEININDLSNTFLFDKEVIDYNKKRNVLDQNYIFNRENYLIKELNYPETYQCGWDESCNLYCSSCRNKIYVADGEKKQELREFSERVKKELFLSHAKKIKVAGLGEAFASDIYKDIMFDKELAMQIGSIGILSNGMLFTKEKFNQLSSLWNDINVFISMDGATKETAETLRGGVIFERWQENMQYLAEMRRIGKINKLAFNFVVQRENFKEMPEFVRMCLEYNADQIKFSKLFNWGCYSKEEFEKMSMFDTVGNMKSELREVLKDDIFLRPEVHLFRWIEW